VDPGPEPDRPALGFAGRGHRQRRRARRLALDILYQADVTGRSPHEVLGQWEGADQAIPSYTKEVVSGVQQDLEAIDGLLERSAEEWTVHRMAAVDRTILRVACYELRSGLPAAVVISEAVEAANELSTDDSGRFINGVLGTVARSPGIASGAAGSVST